MRCPSCDHDNRADRRFCARWSKEFLEAGKKRLLGDTTREATAPEVKTLREENARLKQVLAETVRSLSTKVRQPVIEFSVARAWCDAPS